MQPEQILKFLRVLDSRLEELERDQRDATNINRQDRTEPLRVERDAVSTLRATFLEILDSTSEKD